MRFDFASPTRVIFGPGTLSEAGAVVRTFGRMALVVTGRNTGRAGGFRARLTEAAVESNLFSVRGEPTIETVTRGVGVCRDAGCDVIVGFGGGGAVDAAKAIAAMATNPGEILDYLEVIGGGRPLQRAPLPFVAIPTTAGTGSEVTRNAVLGSPEHRVKVSLRSPLMPARVALVDPELTLDLPPDVTAATGMDALTQCIEAYLSRKANPFTDAFCIDGIRRAARSLRTAVESGGTLEARTDMALSSLYSGVALANAGLGAVHGFAGPIGGMFPAPHGAICASLLPHVLRMNLAALRRVDPSHAVLARFSEIAGWLTGGASMAPDAALEWTETLVHDLEIPPLSRWGISKADIPVLIEKASAASSMKGNPVRLSDDEMTEILERATDAKRG